VLAARQFMRDPFFTYRVALELGLANPESLLPQTLRYRL
jgi:hypothetical protein